MTLFDFFTPKSDTYFLTDNLSVRQALEKFDYHKFTVVPLLTQEGEYLTTVSEGDILRYIKNCSQFDIRQAEDVKVADIEKYRPYKACSYMTDLQSILQIAMDQNFVPIVDDANHFIGIVTRKEILSELNKQLFEKQSEESGEEDL